METDGALVTAFAVGRERIGDIVMAAAVQNHVRFDRLISEGAVVSVNLLKHTGGTRKVIDILNIGIGIGTGSRGNRGCGSSGHRFIGH